MIYTYLYLADMLPRLIDVLSATTIVVLLILIGLIVHKDIFKEESGSDKLIKPMAAGCAVCIALYILLPSPTVLYQWAGVYVAKQVNAQAHIDNKLKTISDIIDIKLEQIKKEIENESKPVRL